MLFFNWNYFTVYWYSFIYWEMKLPWCLKGCLFFRGNHKTTKTHRKAAPISENVPGWNSSQCHLPGEIRGMHPRIQNRRPPGGSSEALPEYKRCCTTWISQTLISWILGICWSELEVPATISLCSCTSSSKPLEKRVQ